MTMTLRIVTAATLALAVASTGAAQDEKISADKLPPKVAAALTTKFPGATITTATKTRENGELIYDIEMTRGGRKHEMDVREDGSIVNFENEIAVKDLPRPVRAAVTARYPKCTLKEAMQVMVTKNGKDIVDEYEVLIVTAEQKIVEVTVSPDGTIKEEGPAGL